MRTSTTILRPATPPLRDTGRRLRWPGTAGRLWSWRQRARCRGSDSSVFFAPNGERGPARQQREQAAKTICARCPVRQPCAVYALNSREPHGVWGGLTPAERAAILHAGGAASGAGGTGARSA